MAHKPKPAWSLFFNWGFTGTQPCPFLEFTSLFESLSSLSLTSRLKFQGLMRLDQTTWIISLFWSHLVRDLPYICKNPFPLALRLVLDRKTRRRLVYTRGLELWGPYQNSACDENGIHTLDIFMSRGPRTRTQILWLLFQPSFQFSGISQTKFPQLLMVIP